MHVGAGVVVEVDGKAAEICLSLRVEAVLAGGEEYASLECYLDGLETVLVGGFLHGCLFAEFFFKLALLLVHAVSDERSGSCADSRADGTAYARAFAAADESAQTCAESGTAATADKAATAAVNIRYIDADSIAAHYNLAKDFKEAQLRQINKIDNAQRTRTSELQKLGNQIQQKINNNGYLSQESFQSDQETFNKKQTEAQNYLASLQREAEQEMIQQQIQLTDSIEAFIKDYNRKKGYDAILYKAAGVYFNPALDITNEVIDGLNKRYNKVAEN